METKIKVGTDLQSGRYASPRRQRANEGGPPPSSSCDSFAVRGSFALLIHRSAGWNLMIRSTLRSSPAILVFRLYYLAWTRVGRVSAREPANPAKIPRRSAPPAAINPDIDAYLKKISILAICGSCKPRPSPDRVFTVDGRRNGAGGNRYCLTGA